MKLQHVAIVFIVIFIPIILVTSYYISLQVETIKLETAYDAKLLDATYDAMYAFEINTANEDLSSVADSLRSIIEASNNIFFNTLTTNMGVSNASKSYVQPFVPAILYTLYDGYYIYAPTNVPEVCTDKFGQTISVGDYGTRYIGEETNSGTQVKFYEFIQERVTYSEYTPTDPVGGIQVSASQAGNDYGQMLYKNNDGTYSAVIHNWSGDQASKSTYYKKSYILKSYIPYSVNYENEDLDTNITINYTLDNFMTVEGQIEKSYYTKSGYLIEKGLVESISVDGETINCLTDNNAWMYYSKETLDKWIKDPENHEITVTINNGKKSDGTDAEKLVISNRLGMVIVNQKNRYWEDAISATQYYVDSYLFSSWVYSNLCDIKASDITNNTYSILDIASIEASTGKSINENQTKLYAKMFHDFSQDTNISPFAPTDLNSSNNPEDEESVFATHKSNIIRNSITYNLTLAMINYTEKTKTTEFNMPIMKETEWDKILHNVSIVSFMQGLRCGLKYYNNYAIVSSTNNEISITENEIYYVPRQVQLVDDNGNQTYILGSLSDDYLHETAHRIDCEKLILNNDDEEISNFFGTNNNWLGAYSFKSKEIKYDKIYSKSQGKYIYDHRVFTDYNCIVDSNYEVTDASGNKIDGNTEPLTYLINNANKNGSPFENNIYYKLLSYRIAIAKERNNLYKTTAFPENYGYQIINKNKTISGSDDINISSALIDRQVKEIKKIEITIEDTENNTLGVYTDKIYLELNGDSNFSYDAQIISTTSRSRRTLEFSKDFDHNSDNFEASLQSIKIYFENSNTKATLKSIRVYYK